MAETRTCRVCGIEKPITRFQKAGIYYAHTCKLCRNDYAYERLDRSRNRERARLINWRVPG